MLGGSVLLGAPTEPPSSVGFSDPGNTIPIKEFRLPSWGYETISLGFNLDGRGSDLKTDYHRTHGRADLDLFLEPAFERYRESDDAITLLEMRLIGAWAFSTRRDELPNDWKESETRTVTGRFDINASWKQYIASVPFLSAFAKGTGRHTVRDYEYRWKNRDTDSFDRTSNEYAVEAGIGLGFGRLREVTPVIRALRLSERWTALDKGPALQDKQIRDVASLIAGRSGYSKVYQRSGKYFWDDVIATIGSGDDLSAFELYYLSDIFYESVGTRLEGWDATINLTVEAREDYLYSEYTWLGASAHGRWYKNHNLNNQTGFELLTAIMNPIDESSEEGAEIGLEFIAKHLWFIADRLSWEPMIRISGNFEAVEGSGDRDEWWRTLQFYRIQSDLTYFIEDLMAIRTSSQFYFRRQDYDNTLGYRHRVDELGWVVDMGLTYYLDRHLSFMP
jgi:hypothetical protein